VVGCGSWQLPICVMGIDRLEIVFFPRNFFDAFGIAFHALKCGFPSSSHGVECRERAAARLCESS